MKNDKTNKVYEYICNFMNSNPYPPSIRDIGKGVGISSTETVVYHLKKLESQGLLIRDKNKNRAIELLKQNKHNTRSIPIIGKVAAGTPILATENIEDNISFSNNLFGDQDELFVLNVCGDSMINAGIYNGDKIVVHKQAMAENGEIVVAMVDDSATVKRFYKENDFIRLQPENDYMEPIIVPNATILGKVVGLIRNYK